MKNITINLLIACCLVSFNACTQDKTPVTTEQETVKPEPHRYGGWFCPDNLNGFPAVDISKWKEVPVVNGRMPTKEEAQNGTSLIFVDAEKYPDAKPLDMTMPRLATYYNEYTHREDLIIVIQAINVSDDSIVGFRYLNGGNGSARINEVKFLYENEIAMFPQTKFVTHSIEINANQEEIWEVLTNPDYVENFKDMFNAKRDQTIDWWKKTNVNFHYPEAGKPTSNYADKLFGNYYVQNDYDNKHYNEKFLLLENKETKTTELKIVTGPFDEDYDNQKSIVNKWSKKVKQLSEI